MGQASTPFDGPAFSPYLDWLEWLAVRRQAPGRPLSPQGLTEGSWPRWEPGDWAMFVYDARPRFGPVLIAKHDLDRRLVPDGRWVWVPLSGQWDDLLVEAGADARYMATVCPSERGDHIVCWDRGEHGAVVAYQAHGATREEARLRAWCRLKGIPEMGSGSDKRP